MGVATKAWRLRCSSASLTCSARAASARACSAKRACVPADRSSALLNILAPLDVLTPERTDQRAAQCHLARVRWMAKIRPVPTAIERGCCCETRALWHLTFRVHSVNVPVTGAFRLGGRMKRLVEFPLDQGGSVLIEVDEPPDGHDLAAQRAALVKVKFVQGSVDFH